MRTLPILGPLLLAISACRAGTGSSAAADDGAPPAARNAGALDTAEPGDGDAGMDVSGLTDAAAPGLAPARGH